MFEFYDHPSGLLEGEAAPTEEIFRTVSSALEAERQRRLADPQEPTPDLASVHQAELWLEWIASSGLPPVRRSAPSPATEDRRRRCA